MMRQRTIKEQLAYGIANDHLSGREEGFKHWMQFYRTLSVEAVARVEALEEHLRVLAKSLHSGDDAPQALEDSIYEVLAPPPAVATVPRIIRQDDAAYDALSESQKRRARLGGMTVEVPRRIPELPADARVKLTTGEWVPNSLPDDRDPRDHRTPECQHDTTEICERCREDWRVRRAWSGR